MNNIDVEACFAYIQSNAQKLGHYEGEIIRLEAKVKATKAALMEASSFTSATMKEASALKDQIYMEVVHELSSATAKKVELGIMIKAAFQKVETARAQMYLSRSELRNLQ